MDWNNYVIYDPGVMGPLPDLSRADARRAFERLMEAKPGRIETLRRLLNTNGVELGVAQGQLQAVNDWFRASIEEDPSNPGRLLPDWYSVVNDLALFLGDAMINRHPNLRWQLFVWGKKDVSYQRHVIMGFSQVANPKYNVDIDRLLATYGHRIIRGDFVEEDAFSRWLGAIGEKA